MSALADIGQRIWDSFFRHPWPDTARQRTLIVMSNFFLHIQPLKVRTAALRVTYNFCLGGLTFFFFLVLTITGIVLMFYYVPSTQQAYQSMLDLETIVAYGMFIRNMHRWAAHAMVIAVFLHMFRVFYTRSYRHPREFNWVIGIILLIVTNFMSYTGYLLPWDQLSYWAVTVGTNMGGAVPYVGPIGRFITIGGFDVGQNTLIRFYTLHVIGLPALAAVLMGVHFWRIRKDGYSKGL
jgi:quinol-cytochrome oxidoreductase complex cytochrome b subunit